jgi:hypothetical protein
MLEVKVKELIWSQNLVSKSELVLVEVSAGICPAPDLRAWSQSKPQLSIVAIREFQRHVHRRQSQVARSVPEKMIPRQ